MSAVREIIAGLYLAISIWPIPASALELPTNAVSMFNTSDRRIDWWAKNFVNVEGKPRLNCWFNQPGGYVTPCRQVFSVDQIFRDIERSFLMDKSPEADLYARNRTSLFENPVPFVPNFIPRTETRKLLPISDLVESLRRENFDKSSIPFLEIFHYQWGWNISYESININSALEAGWNFWERAASKETHICDKKFFKKDLIGIDPFNSECVAIVWLTSTKHKLEPAGFSKGVAVCRTEPNRLFYFGCSLVTMQTTGGKKYVKAMVGPPVAMGGGAFADDFGRFMLKCKFVQGTMAQRLREVKQAFGFGEIYNVSSTIEISANTGFRYFENAKKWGMVLMIAKGELGREITFTFYGKWGNENVNNNRMPLFLDPDVELFKRIFEAVIGKDSCSKESIVLPTIAQR